MRKRGLPERLDDKHYTYGDSRHWPEDERWELIDGVAFWMATPSFDHQAISMELSVQLGTFLKGPPSLVQQGTVVCPVLDGSELELASLWSEAD
ncbi:MAG: hypothetical protein WCG80_17730 [Spirochaetales bacterium]